MRSYQGAQWEGTGDSSATEGGRAGPPRLGPARACPKGARPPLGASAPRPQAWGPGSLVGGAKAPLAEEEEGRGYARFWGWRAARSAGRNFFVYDIMKERSYRVRRITCPPRNLAVRKPKIRRARVQGTQGALQGMQKSSYRVRRKQSRYRVRKIWKYRVCKKERGYRVREKRRLFLKVVIGYPETGYRVRKNRNIGYAKKRRVQGTQKQVQGTRKGYRVRRPLQGT